MFTEFFDDDLNNFCCLLFCLLATGLVTLFLICCVGYYFLVDYYCTDISCEIFCWLTYGVILFFLLLDFSPYRKYIRGLCGAVAEFFKSTISFFTKCWRELSGELEIPESKTGWFLKKSHGFFKFWNRRYFQLRQGTLMYSNENIVRYMT